MVKLQAKRLVKRFNNKSDNVINKIDLEINEGDFLSIIGKSGAGKSTLLYMLSGLEEVTSGSIIFKNEDITTFDDSKLSMLRRNNFGFIFQFYNLIPDITAYDNIAFPLELRGEDKKSIEKKILKYSHMVKIENKLSNFPHELSGGEQQRIAIVRALAIEPEIIFADEPTGNLDSKTTIEILKILKMLNENYNTTIVMVTHDNEAANYGNRLIEIKDGQIINKTIY